MRRILIALTLLAGLSNTAPGAELDLAAPPRLDARQSRAFYGPLAALLSNETGETVEYVHPGSWFEYQLDMRENRYELLLDDAHFASWRIESLGHVPLVKTREQIRYVIVATKTGRIYSKEDLIGRAVCAAPPPDLGTIGMLQKFEGLFQVPRILETRGTLDRVQRLLAGDCAGAVLARHEYTQTGEISRLSGQLKIITQTEPYPGLTLTAAGSLPGHLREAIKRVFLSRKGGEVTGRIRERFANGSNFVEAAAGDYEGLAGLLSGYPAFDE